MRRGHQHQPATSRIAIASWLSRDPLGEYAGINLYGYVLDDPVNGIDPLGLACNPSYLSNPSQKPPGWNPNWKTGTDPRGPYSEDPNSGMKYYPHEEDDYHWPHYDKSSGGRYPENSLKPWPNQKRSPYRNQSDKNPWPDSGPSPLLKFLFDLPNMEIVIPPFILFAPTQPQSTISSTGGGPCS